MNIPVKKMHSQHHFVTMLTVQIYLRDWEVYVPPSDATNTACTVRDALYAIGYPGPLFNHLDRYYVCRITKIIHKYCIFPTSEFQVYETYMTIFL